MVAKTAKGIEKKKVAKAAPKASLTVKKSVQKKVTISKKGQPKKKISNTRVLVPKEQSKSTKIKVTIFDRTVAPAAKKEIEKLAHPTQTQDILPRKSLYPMIQSLYRFPVPSAQAVSMTARVSGVFFVIAGAIFSLVYLQTIQGDVVGSEYFSQQAEVYSATSGSTSGSQMTASDTVVSEPTSTITTVANSNPTPDARISVEYSGTVLHGEVKVVVSVPNATTVKLVAYSKTASKYFALGLMSRVDDGTWEYKWGTAAFPDGEYFIKAIITNAYGTYDRGDTAMAYSVKNTTETTATSAPGTAVESTVQTTTTEAVAQQGGTIDDVSSVTVTDNSAILRTTENITQNTETIATSSTAEVVSEPSKIETVLEPSIALKLSQGNPLSGYVDVYAETSPVSWVEVYALPKNALSPFFLGLATKMQNDGTKWKFLWQTPATPNGDYKLYVRVKNEFGFTTGSKKDVRIENYIKQTLTESENETVTKLAAVNDDLITVSESGDSDAKDVTEGVESKIVYIEPAKTFVETIDVSVEEKEDVGNILDDFRKKLDEKMNELAEAQRKGDDEKLNAIQISIENLQGDVLKQLSSTVAKEEVVNLVNTYLSRVSYELKTLTLKNEAILKERVGDAILKDSDNDEISDYDEINLYATNPFAADSDNDGYIDSAELKKGFDPMNSKAEALIAYESPKETGILRDDIVEITSITTLKEEGSTGAPQALISGKGLPNSYVTLYIFSTPVVVTVKTNSQGEWNYIFDKELENGDHEIYAGMTDNAGKIVAKSSPLPFVKTAEAYAGKTEQVTESEISKVIPSFTSTNSLLLIASIAVVALGLVLLLLGLHIPKERNLDLATS